MKLTSAQIRGRIKNIAKLNNADARLLMRLFMMERFLERAAISNYKDNFIIKGGILVTAMVGVSLRSTMDIDTSIKNANLSLEDAIKMVDEIKDINLEDGVTFEMKDALNIMDDMEYPGVRVLLNGKIEDMITPLKIDISTGDVITPGAIEYQYQLLLEDRTIQLWSYNLETVLAEKLQTILSRGVLNTRMRDFYDVYTLMKIYEEKIDVTVFCQAFKATCERRGTGNLLKKEEEILHRIENSLELTKLWDSYRKKFVYASEVEYINTIEAIKSLLLLLNK